MAAYIGLYYPFIHFKDDSWLKLTALYWDKMGRIVPEEYGTPRDSETVKKLMGELEFIKNFHPAGEAMGIGQKFLEVLQRHQNQLRDRYAVYHRNDWPEDPITKITAPPGTDPRLGYVFYEKMWPDLQAALVQTELALPERGGDPRWVGMHPNLVSVYMTALAAEMASNRGLYPVTDETLDHLAVSGYTLERIAQALLGNVQLTSHEPTPHEIEVQMATIALQSVIPKDMASVPIEKIVKLRKQHRDELTAFQTYVHGLANNMPDLQEIKNPEAIKMHLDEEHEKNLKPKLESLRKSMKSVGINSVLSAINVEVKLPALLATVGLASMDPILATTGAIAFSTLTVIREKRKEYEKQLQDSPTAFLWRVEHELQPTTLASWTSQTAKRFLFGI